MVINRFSVYSAESLAILSVIEHFNVYFPDKKSVVFTDCAGVIDELRKNGKKRNEMINKIKLNINKNKLIAYSMLLLHKDLNDSFHDGKHLHLVSFDIYKAFDRIWPQTILRFMRRIIRCSHFRIGLGKNSWYRLAK